MHGYTSNSVRRHLRVLAMAVTVIIAALPMATLACNWMCLSDETSGESHELHHHATPEAEAHPIAAHDHGSHTSAGAAKPGAPATTSTHHAHGAPTAAVANISAVGACLH